MHSLGSSWKDFGNRKIAENINYQRNVCSKINNLWFQQSQASQIVLENPDKGPDLEIENPAVFEWFYAKWNKTLTVFAFMYLF